MSVFDDSEELMEDFREESRSSLESGEAALLLTEKEATFEEGYAEVFRAFHSIKGLSSMFGLDNIQKHFHFLESLLVKYKDGPSFPSELVDYLLSSMDAAHRMIAGKDVEFDLYDPVNEKPGSLNEENLQNSSTAIVKEEKSPTPNVDAVSGKKVDERRDLIFVVEDEEDLRLIYCNLLMELDCEIKTFATANEALSALDCTTFIDHPSVIISDLQMPGMSGSELLSHVNTINPDIPLIVLSGYLNKETSDHLLAEGAYGILSKPVKELELFFMVRSAIAFKKSQVAARKSLKFLFYFLSQNKTMGGNEKQVLEDEIKTLMNELKAIRHQEKKAA